MQALEAGLPPTEAELPPELRGEFAQLARLEDEALWKIARSSLPLAKQRTLSRLLRKNQEDTLTEAERQKLDALIEETDRLTLRKALAYALLKWRRHSLPSLAELRPSREA